MLSPRSQRLSAPTLIYQEKPCAPPFFPSLRNRLSLSAVPEAAVRPSHDRGVSVPQPRRDGATDGPSEPDR